MANLFAIKADQVRTSVGQMSAKVAMATCARLASVANVNDNFPEAHEVWDGLVDANAIVSRSILNMAELFLAKISTAVVNYIAKFLESVDDRGVGQFIRRVEDLNVRERAVDIL